MDPRSQIYLDYNRCSRCRRPMVMVTVDRESVGAEGLTVIEQVGQWKHWAPMNDLGGGSPEGHDATVDMTLEEEVASWR